MEIQAAIQKLLEHRDLSTAEMRQMMEQILTGHVSEIALAGFLVALRAKGESVDEIAAAAEVLRNQAQKIDVGGRHLVDTCGTGGDASGTFNISTTAAFVVAAAGGRVAKHGNRSVSSRSGSADVLERAGVNLALTPAQVKRCIEEIGVGFLFAPSYHGAMKSVAPVRRELAIRTLFNLLGPLLNPASAPNQLLGVFDRRYVEPLAKVLNKLGSQHVLVVHADDGLDEISLAGTTWVAELRNKEVSTYEITPEQFGISRTSLQEIRANSADQSLEIMRQVLRGRQGPAADIVALNAGAAIYAANLTDNLSEGIRQAQEIIASGAAMQKLDSLVEWTQNAAHKVSDNE